jgi:hypothetical protein
MSEIRVMSKNIMDFRVTSKVIEPKDAPKYVATEIKFVITDNAKKYDDILQGMAADVPMDVTFSSNQLKMDVDGRSV